MVSETLEQKKTPKQSYSMKGKQDYSDVQNVILGKCLDSQQVGLMVGVEMPLWTLKQTNLNSFQGRDSL